MLPYNVTQYFISPSAPSPHFTKVVRRQLDEESYCQKLIIIITGNASQDIQLFCRNQLLEHAYLT